MPAEAVITSNEKIMSSVMRRAIVKKVAPLLSTGGSNPLYARMETTRVIELLQTYGQRIREGLEGLRQGIYPISEFRRFIDANLSKEPDLTPLIAEIRKNIDEIADTIRSFLRGAIGEEALDKIDPDLKEEIAAARLQYSTARSIIVDEGDVEVTRGFLKVKRTNGPLISDPTFGKFFNSFLESGHKGLGPQVRRVFLELASLPIGQGLYITEIAKKLDMDVSTLRGLFQSMRAWRLVDAQPGEPGFMIEGKSIVPREPGKGRIKYNLTYYGRAGK